MKRTVLTLVVALFAVASLGAAPGARLVGVNVVLKTAPDTATLARLSAYGKVRDVIPEINGVTMQAPEGQLDAIRALPFVAAAGVDQLRKGGPAQGIDAATFSATGLNTWNLDAVNVTDFGAGRVQPYTGAGVYIAVLDTGLVNSWPAYFPAARIDVTDARCFGGGGGDVGFVSSQPNKWQEDQNSHGTHVTSTILGYSFGGTPINGVAPDAMVIPVKVLNQNGSGWSSVIARGIVYVADLKQDALADHPVVISMSLGGPGLDPLEKSAIDYAIAKGVIVVAAAGNEGEAGMGYPGAYAPVISVAAYGWANEWVSSRWWYGLNVVDPVNPADYYITDFSSRQKAGQDLDVAAPGSWVVGPYQDNGQLSYHFLGGTSMATPHVSGIVALMLQKDGSLTSTVVETILESTAIPLTPGCRNVLPGPTEYCWGADATGAGLVTADAALSAIGAQAKPGKK